MSGEYKANTVYCTSFPNSNRDFFSTLIDNSTLYFIRYFMTNLGGNYTELHINYVYYGNSIIHLQSTSHNKLNVSI